MLFCFYCKRYPTDVCVEWHFGHIDLKTSRFAFSNETSLSIYVHSFNIVLPFFYISHACSRTKVFGGVLNQFRPNACLPTPYLEPAEVIKAPELPPSLSPTGYSTLARIVHMRNTPSCTQTDRSGTRPSTSRQPKAANAFLEKPCRKEKNRWKH